MGILNTNVVISKHEVDTRAIIEVRALNSSVGSSTCEKDWKRALIYLVECVLS